MIYRTYADLAMTPQDWRRLVAKGFKVKWARPKPRLPASVRCDYVKAAVEEYLAIPQDLRFLKGTLKRVALKHQVQSQSVCMRIKRMKDRGELPC